MVEATDNTMRAARDFLIGLLNRYEIYATEGLLDLSDMTEPLPDDCMMKLTAKWRYSIQLLTRRLPPGKVLYSVPDGRPAARIAQ